MYCTNNSWQVSDFADIASIIIAAVNIFFTIYIFTYQKNKDKEDAALQSQKEIDAKTQALYLQEQNIKLQWFKELIVQPHINDIKTFYKNLYSLEDKLNVKLITEDLKIEATEFIKTQGAILRKSFIDILHSVNPKLHSEIKKNVDDLIDDITRKIIDAGLNLNDNSTFQREIGAQISYSNNDLISKLFNFKCI